MANSYHPSCILCLQAYHCTMLINCNLCQKAFVQKYKLFSGYVLLGELFNTNSMRSTMGKLCFRWLCFDKH